MTRPRRRPFWLPAANYYFLATAAAVLIFVVVWGIFHDEMAETPILAAGIAASSFMVFAVFLREFVLRRMYRRRAMVQRQLDHTIAEVYARHRPGSREKLTVERNAEILAQIKRRSDAAASLAKFASGHREVFEMCGEYIALVDREFATVGVGSPRIAAMRRGRDKAMEFHRYHMLQWASIEARSLIRNSSSGANMLERSHKAHDAMDVVETALEFYPEERALIESKALISEMLTTIKVSDKVNEAERSAADGQYARARNLYRDALFYLGREHLGRDDQANTQADSVERESVARKIIEAMESIRQLEEDKN